MSGPTREVTAAALQDVRVLDLTDVAGSLCARLLGDLGADVVRVEPPGGARIRRLPPIEPGCERGEASHVDWFYDHQKRGVVIDVATPPGVSRLRELIAAADVVVTARPPDLLGAAGLSVASLREANPATVLVEVTPFGTTGPRSRWYGSDLVAAARGGMIYVNGHEGTSPIAPFGLQAYNSAGIFAAVATLCALRARELHGRGSHVDVSVAHAAAAAVEHVTGFHRQTGLVERRRGTLHWSRYFRIGRCADGFVLHSTLGDWTTLAEWVASDGEAFDLRDPRWEEPATRKEGCEHIFDCLDAWGAHHTIADLVEGAQLRRLPYAAVAQAHEIAGDEQLAARRFPAWLTMGDGVRVPFPGPPVLLSATPWRPPRRPPRLGEHDEEVRRDPSWQTRSTVPDAAATRQKGLRTDAPEARGDRHQAPRVLDGITVLDFTWVVAGPVATRLLADQGARVVKVERKDAMDFGTRRGGLTGNLNRGKQSVVLDLGDPRGIDLVRRLAGRADVVIDNFSARVMRNWGLDYDRLRELRPGVIAVAMSGFGLTGPRHEQVSYGPTLQALLGFPFTMRLPGGPPAGWGYSWSDMLGGMVAALATLAALRHRDRTGEGQLVDLGQHGALAAFLGPALFALLRGREVAAPGNDSQEGEAVPHGVYRCAAEHPPRPGAAPGPDGTPDDDRWIAIAVLDDAAWGRLAELLAAAGEAAMLAPDLATVAGRAAARNEIESALGRFTRSRRAAEVEELLQAHGVPAGVVADGADLAADPQLHHRGYFPTRVTPEGGSETFDGVPFVTSTVPGRVSGPGPLLGEHSDLVLRDLLGLREEEIATLRREGVVA